MPPAFIVTFCNVGGGLGRGRVGGVGLVESICGLDWGGVLFSRACELIE